MVIRLPALVIDFASYEMGIYAHIEIRRPGFCLSKAYGGTFFKKFDPVSSSGGFLALDMWELGGGTGGSLNSVLRPWECNNNYGVNMEGGRWGK